MQKKTDYHKMSVAEKELYNRQHDIPTRCPVCHVAVMPSDERAHVERCTGRPAPGPQSRWLNHRDSIKAGVRKQRLSELAKTGRIRTKDCGGRKLYLMRDITRFLAAQDRRSRAAKERATASELTRGTGKGRISGRMSKPKPELPLKQRVSEYVTKAGSYASASRQLDVPINSLKRAAKGETLRRGTELLILNQLREAGES